MKHKTWFRLVIKAIGVLLVASSFPYLGMGISQLLIYSSFGATNNPFNANVQAGSVVWIVGSLIQLALGIYLFFGGKLIVNRCIPSNRPYCPDCGYDLSKTTSGSCPECGIVLPTEPPNLDPHIGQ